MALKAIIFDLGDTLIHQQVDAVVPLDKLDLVLLPHVAEVLPQLSARYRLGIASNTTQSTATHVHAALTRLGIDQHFTGIVTSFECHSEKPDPHLFVAILERLRAEPRESLMVGNDPKQDIEGARAVGLWTGLYSREAQPQRTNADFDFNDFRELPQRIEALEGRNDGRDGPSSSAR